MLVSTIPFNVLLDLRPPELLPSGWPFEDSALVAVPEAPVHENDRAILREDNVWFPSKIPAVQAVTITLSM